MIDQLKALQRENEAEFDLSLKQMGYSKDDSGQGYFTESDIRRLLVNIGINPMSGFWIGFVNQCAKHYGKAETIYAFEQTAKYTNKPNQAYVTSILEKRRTKNEAEQSRKKAEQEKREFEKNFKPEDTAKIFTDALKNIPKDVPTIDKEEAERKRIKRIKFEQALKNELGT